MKKPFNYFLLLTFTVGLFSCAIWPNSKLGFDVYEKQVKNNCEYSLLTNGVYLPISEKGHPFFFFTNGLIEWGGWVQDFKNIPSIDYDLERFSKIYSTKEYWGCYELKNDSIIIQVFNRNNMEFYKRQVVEFKGILQSDTSLVLVSGKYYLDDFQIIDKPETYYYYPIQLKPDSTKAWFNNKKWFKNNLHESRKVD